MAEPAWRAVARNVRSLRKARGWTQSDIRERLAERGLDYSKATYSALECAASGTRIRSFTADEILTFAQIFGVPIDELFRLGPRYVRCPGCHGVGLVVTETERSDG